MARNIAPKSAVWVISTKMYSPRSGKGIRQRTASGHIAGIQISMKMMSGCAVLIVRSNCRMEARTRSLLDVARARGAVDVVVNTHANGDHCYGNGVVARAFPQARIVSTTAAALEMPEVPPSLMAWATRAMRVVNVLPGFVGDRVRFGPATLHELARYWLDGFARFDFGGIRLHAPTETFDDELHVSVGDVDVHLIELGPAHTKGDAIAWVPKHRVLFTGDLLFHGGTPIVWAGPLSRWIAACDRMLALDAAVVVPGHGPIANNAALQDVRDYLAFVDAEARPFVESGVPAFEVARALLSSASFVNGPWSTWTERERIAVNVDAVARELGKPGKKPFALFAEMAALTRA